MINLIFPDGSIVSGSTYAEVEQSLRASQWRTFESRRDFRREMRRRGEVWSGRKPKPVVWQSSRAFVRSLADAGLCMIEESAPTTTITTTGGHDE